MSRCFLLTMFCACVGLSEGWVFAGSNATGGGEMPITQRNEELILFHFGANADVSAWRVVNDTVMGGVSRSRVEISEDGFAVFSGLVSLENNGGFASVRGPLLQQSLGKSEGLAIRVKGDGKKYKCGLRTDNAFDGTFHQATFQTRKGEWQVVKIPFSEFVPTYHGRRLPEDKRMKLEDIRSVSFLIADKQSGPFRLEIEWIKAYRAGSVTER